MKEQFGCRSLRVLAVDPTWDGFGFALFEGPRRLLDWGTRQIREDKNRVALRRIKELILRYEPAVLVVEDCRHASSRRNRRVRSLTDQMLVIARRSGVRGYALPIAAVYLKFAQSNARTKYEIASLLARKFPALALRLPPKRKFTGEAEDHRMSIFDAAAFGYTYLAKRRQKFAPHSTNTEP